MAESHPATLDQPVSTRARARPGGQPFAARLARARQKRNEDWWSIILGGPIAQVLAALFGDVRWITPNRVTWAGFLLKLACVPLLVLDSRAADLAAVVCLQLNVVFDCLDGVLARYRKAGSASGAFLDKVTDAVGLFAVVLAVAARLLPVDRGAALALVVGCALWCVRVYAYWVVAFLEKDHGLPRPTAAADLRKPFGALTFPERLGYYAASTWRIVLVAEADVYFWLGLALIFGWLRPIAWGVGLGLAAWSVIILGHRYRSVVRVDAWVRARS